MSAEGWLSEHNFSHPEEPEYHSNDPILLTNFTTFLNKGIKYLNDSGEVTTETELLGPAIQTQNHGPLGWGDVALLSLFCSIIAGTVAGNTLVIAAVITTRRLRTVTNCFVMSLAVADWLVGVFVMPPKVALYLVHNEWKLGGFFCELWIALDILLCTASILSLCAISIDRYLAITRPLAYSRRRRSKRLALSMISCVWVAAAVITSPPIFGWYDETRNVENKCEYNENVGYVVYSALGSFFLPLLVMLYVYARIACVIARRQNSIQRLSYSASDKKSQSYVVHEAEEQLRAQARLGQYERAEEDAAAYKDNRLQRNTSSGNEESEDQEEQGMEHGEISPKEGERRASFWKLCRFQTCMGSSEETHGTGNNWSGSGGAKGGPCSSDSDSASGMALSLPDPATLSGSGESSANHPNEQKLSRSTSSLSRPCGHVQSQQRVEGHAAGIAGRGRTGTRLCHHSIVTTSPQRHVHRAHQTASTTRLYLEHELVPLEESKGLTLSKSTPRVWTVEETSMRNSNRAPNGRTKSCSLKQRNSNASNGRSGSRYPGTPATLTVPLSSPAGNPASLMSSPGESSSVPKGGTRSSMRIYQGGNHFGANQPLSTNSSNMMRRGRSMKLTLNLGPEQNGSSTISRDFVSGRVASFKRETKTAQTLAAVVGGFIICWLPFFVGYISGPFIPSSAEIPTALMDALIWLGWSNSTINPFIYAFYSPDFRSAFWRLTVRKCGTLLRTNRHTGRSPRRYDDHNNTQSRLSA